MNHYTHPIPVGKKGNKALYDKDFKENYFLPILSKSAFTFVYILSTKKNSATSHKIEKGRGYRKKMMRRPLSV